MSAPLQMTAEQMRDVAAALDALTKIARNHDVEIGGYGGVQEIRHRVSDTVLRLTWDDDNGYVIDDRVGG